jgi:cation:H+ antiporter
VTVAIPAFLAGALISLATSWLLVSRLERVGERLGLSEALLGLVAALAADAPEITAAVSAMAGHQQRIGAGVIIGSNVFNLAALLGLSAIVAGRVSLHRRVVLLGGAVAMWVAVTCLVVVLGLVPPAAGLMLGLGAVAVYAVVLGLRDLGPLPLPRAWINWLRSAVTEEELELEEAIRPESARKRDFVVAVGALLVVVASSVLMELAASALGSRYAVPEIIVGGLVLAAVTSLPNAVAAIYLASRGRGAATFSTALNSNALNVTVGLLIPASVIGIGGSSSQTTIIALWYAGLTAVVLGFAYRDSGIRRPIGIVIVIAYVIFAGSIISVALAGRLGIAVSAGSAVIIAAGASLVLKRRGSEPLISPGPLANGRAWPSRQAWPPQGLAGARSLLPGWTVGRIWLVGLGMTLFVAATDAALGSHVVLIGLLIVGPCVVLLTGRWIPTGLTGVLAAGLAVALGIPDGIWGTTTHLDFLAAVVAVALATTVAAAAITLRSR